MTCMLMLVLKLEYMEFSRLQRVIAAEGHLIVILRLHSDNIFTVHFFILEKKG